MPPALRRPTGKEVRDEPLQLLPCPDQQHGAPPYSGHRANLQCHTGRILPGVDRAAPRPVPPGGGGGGNRRDAPVRRVEEGSATRRDVQRFKARHFDYATFSGEFTRRGEEGLLRHSGLICFDFDHIGGWKGGEGIGGVYGLRYVLSRDPSLDTVLLFRSPGGDGLKWVVAVDLARATHAEWFDALSCYVARNYGVETDPSGRDVARSCYLPWDPEALMLEGGRL